MVNVVVVAVFRITERQIKHIFYQKFFEISINSWHKRLNSGIFKPSRAKVS